MSTGKRIDGVEGGTDSWGNTYASTSDMWKKELGKANPESQQGWYGKAVRYWGEIEPTVDGILGGFGSVTEIDLKESRQFLVELTQNGSLTLEEESRAVDCGAGIGRITEGLLCHMFKTVDLVEPVDMLLEEAKKKLTGRNAGDFLLVGLQDFSPKKAQYDVIWIQWVIGHLTDDDFCAFFLRCRYGLKPGGIIVLKENVCKEGFIVDKDDSSVTRSDVYLRGLLEKAGMNLVHSKFQQEFPKELFQVCMYAVR
mmetsp:Transcript_64721/g.159285  ORF Transcript_64721/g.159285 Transcript_64721/m.159285 type:complete len:254 (-) Transcript_64721:263-1024(-)|eukprot:CAMPEP_0206230310 /NCGR_PEP_ID=MMETSP0047_2-20121206/10188_1 /ASSEMBLY_ACC=CAM_ASM_000192 /TAXON_ID=195065 /ORGANISM="Chroomonas mesostigmatica_cf, Strain CCMP1168" /LENGTH=253 /DNA_ID=CAMNT_0053653719 /DNA_START=1 /DNA_END=762 /DNA_ORIENTATION=+